jgi:hypothetical protein
MLAIKGPQTVGHLPFVYKIISSFFSQSSLVIIGRYICIAISCMALHVYLIILETVVSPSRKLKAIDLNQWPVP